MNQYDYPMVNAEKATSGMSIRRQTLRERLIEQKTVLESQLNNINEALEFLAQNPSFENFHNVIGKAGF